MCQVFNDFFTEMLASEQLKPVVIDDIDQTEYKIIDLKSDTTYLVYLLAVTLAEGNATFVEDSTNALGGVFHHYMCCHTEC